MQEGKLIAISDVHLDAWQRQEPDRHAAKHEAFLDFLAWVRDGSDAEQFAIVGDLLDIPQPGRAPLPGRYEDVAAALRSLLDAGLRVHYVVGNHDAGLMALDLHLAEPHLRVAPQALVRCGDALVSLEHGHLLDAWLWEYVQHQTTGLGPASPRAAMAHFLADGDAEVGPPPMAEFVHETLFAALQFHAMQTGFSSDEMRCGIRVMSQHLGEDFGDVAHGDEAPPYEAEIAGLMEGLGLSVEELRGEEELPEAALRLFVPLGLRYYSPLPWRRAAGRRLRQLRRRHGSPVTALILGHTHCPDRHAWQAEGQALQYANCGGWVGASGSYVSFAEGKLTVHRRTWDEALP